MDSIAGGAGAIIGVVAVCVLVLLGILAILMPVFVYFIHESTKNIRFQAQKINDNLERIIYVLGRQAASPQQENVSETSDFALGSPITLADDPNNHKIGNLRCNACGLEMPYPKRLSGSDVKCHSCEQPFQLP